MKRRLLIGIYTGLIASAMVLCYRAGRVKADGPPAKNPLVYTGVLEDNGQPATGSKSVSLVLWSAAVNGMAVCTTTPAAPVTLDGGRFSVPLDDSCTPAIKKTPDLWLGVIVDSTSLGRTRLGAVPYALEAGSAASASGALKSQLVPPGTIVAFAGKSPPEGWLLCDGAPVSRSMFFDLFAAVGTGWGAGDGVNTFNLPDLRGRFLRGVDMATARDPDAKTRPASNLGGNLGDAVGSLEVDTFMNHAHAVADPGHAHAEQIGASPGATYVWSNAGPVQGFVNFGPINIPTAPAVTGIAVGGATTGRIGVETRPINAAVTFMIKL